MKIEMKTLLLLSITLLFCFSSNISNAQDGAFRVRTDNYVQIGYDVYKALTFGQSLEGELNNGAWGVESWNNGFNVFQPYPNLKYGNYRLFIRSDNNNVGIGKFPNGDEKLQVNGAVCASAYNTCSDRRYKNNIEPLKNGLTVILSLQPYSFDYDTQALMRKYNMQLPVDGSKDDMGDELDLDIDLYTNRKGLMAQDVREYIPSAVTEDSEGDLTLNYQEIIPFLIGAIQDQQEQIEALKKEIEKLK